MTTVWSWLTLTKIYRCVRDRIHTLIAYRNPGDLMRVLNININDNTPEQWQTECSNRYQILLWGYRYDPDISYLKAHWNDFEPSYWTNIGSKTTCTRDVGTWIQLTKVCGRGLALIGCSDKELSCGVRGANISGHMSYCGIVFFHLTRGSITDIIARHTRLGQLNVL